MRKNLLTVLILALLIVNIILTSVMMFSVMGANKQTARLVNDIATVLNIELSNPGEEVKTEISLKDTQIYNVSGALTIPLTSEDGKTSYAVFNLALSMNMKHEDYETYSGTMLDKEGLIKDAVTSVVSAHTENECRNNLEGLKEEILQEIQKLFESDFIYKVGISDVKFG